MNLVIGCVTQKYVGFAGRARRKEFWLFSLVMLVITWIAMFFDTAIGFTMPVDLWGQMFGIGVLYTIVVLALFLPALAVTVRRLHDTNRRGWWYLILFVPFIGWIWFLVLLCLKGTEGENRFGPDPLTE